MKIMSDTSTFKPIEIISIPLSVIKPDPDNLRRHSRHSINAIKASYRRFGQQKPIVITKDNMVIAGNGALIAASELWWSEISCVVSELSGKDIRAYAVADNRTAEMSEWGEEIRKAAAELFDELGSADFDILGLSDLLHEADTGEFPDDDETREDEILEDMELRPYENYDYIAFFFTDHRDMMFAAEKLGLKQVHANDGKVGIGRVLNGERLITLIEGGKSC